MKRILETIGDTTLLLALLILLILPIVAFAGFSPTTQGAKLIARKATEPVNTNVLGAENFKENQIFTEVLATGYDDVQIEEIEKTDTSYSVRVFAGLNPAEDRNMKIIRLSNASLNNKSVKFQLSEVKGNADGVLITLNGKESLDANKVYARGLIEKDGNLEIGLLIPAESASPISFTLSAQFLNQ